MEGILIITLESGSKWNFFWKNCNFNFLFHPRHWGFRFRINKHIDRKYEYSTLVIRFLFIQLFCPLNLVRKPLDSHFRYRHVPNVLLQKHKDIPRRF